MRFLLIVCLFLSANIAFAQNGVIKGYINTADKQPAEYVNVGLKGTTKGSFTDANGEFQIKNVAPGTYTLVATVMGMKGNEQEVEVEAGEVTSIVITLTETSTKLQEVKVTQMRNKYNENNTSSSLRLQTPIQELPQNIQVVTPSMLKDQQVISMSDGLIRNVSGLVRSEHWGDMYTNITARGSQIQAFRNGFNVVNSYWGPLTEDMSFVDNIEFVKGPAGFMLSSGDPSGLYNVVTRKPTGISKGEVNFTVGSFNLYRAALDLDGKLSKNGKLLYRLNVAGQNKNTHRANEYNDRYSIAPVISYQLDNKTKLTLEYNYQRANMSNVGSYYVWSTEGFGTHPVGYTTLPAGTPGVKINDHSVYLNLQHEFNDKWKITAQAARFMYNQIGTSMWPTAVQGDSMIRYIGIWDSKSTMNMGQVFVNGNFKTGFINHKVLAGLDMAKKEYLADWSQSHDLDDTTNWYHMGDPADLNDIPQGYPDFDRSKPLVERARAGFGWQDQAYTSIYVQDELGFVDNKLRLTLAGRYTTLQMAYAGPADSASHFTPRVGLSASIDKNTAVYALYDQAFMPQSGNIRTGKVQPITGNNIELGVKRQWMDGKWSTGLTVYRILKNNELTSDPTDPSFFYSVEMGQKISEGVEFDLKGTIVRGLSIVANYAYTDSRISKVTDGVTLFKVGDVVPGFSKHTANAWLTYRVTTGALKGFGVSAGATFLGARATYWDPSPNGGSTLPDYFKLDGGLSWEGDKVTITANVFNILNEYLYSGSYYAWLGAYNWQTDPPRNLRLSVGYRF